MTTAIEEDYKCKDNYRNFNNEKNNSSNRSNGMPTNKRTTRTP